MTAEVEQGTFDGDAFELAALNLTSKQLAEFVAALDGDIYRRLPKARMALILRLEALRTDGSKTQKFRYVSLEHVLPQTPPASSQWVEWFPEEDVRESWTHRLANLVPLHLKKNPEAGNFDFETKKNVYFKGKGTCSPFILTNEVRSIDKWTPSELQDRQRSLLKRLAEHWMLPVT